MTFFNNPHKGFNTPNNLYPPNQNFIQVGPNMYQDQRTGLVYIQTPQGLMLYNQNPQVSMQQPIQSHIQQPMQPPMQPGMMPNIYPNQGMTVNQPMPYMQPNPYIQHNIPIGFNNQWNNNLNNQDIPSFNPRYNTPDLKPIDKNSANKPLRYESQNSTSNPNPNLQQGSNMEQVIQTQDDNFKLSEIDLRFSIITPFTSRIRDKEIKVDEVFVDHVFSNPSETIYVCLKDRQKEDNVEKDSLIVVPKANIGSEYFITDEEDKKLIKDLFKENESIRVFISDLVYALNNANSEETMSFLIDYNKFLTDKINDTLNNNLNINIIIDSFVDDYAELCSVIDSQFQNTDINDKVIRTVYKTNSITRELIEGSDEVPGIYAIADRVTIVIVPDVIEIYTKHYDKIRKLGKNKYELNPKEDIKLIKLISVVTNELDKELLGEEFVIGFINRKFLNVYIDKKNNVERYSIN